MQWYSASHTSMHPRITHPYYAPNEPTSPVGRWSRRSLFYLLASSEQQTFFKIEQTNSEKKQPIELEIK